MRIGNVLFTYKLKYDIENQSCRGRRYPPNRQTLDIEVDTVTGPLDESVFLALSHGARMEKFDLAFFAAPKPPEDEKEREAEVPVLVIENKFKSLPNEEQITRYRKKLKDKSTVFYFLALFDTDSKGVGSIDTPAGKQIQIASKKDVIEGLDMMAHEIIETYNQLYNKN